MIARRRHRGTGRVSLYSSASRASSNVLEYGAEENIATVRLTLAGCSSSELTTSAALPHFQTTHSISHVSEAIHRTASARAPQGNMLSNTRGFWQQRLTTYLSNRTFERSSSVRLTARRIQRMSTHDRRLEKGSFSGVVLARFRAFAYGFLLWRDMSSKISRKLSF